MVPSKNRIPYWIDRRLTGKEGHLAWLPIEPVRAELDSAVVPSVRGQPGASVSVRLGVQPWELPSPVMPAQGGQALVAAERAGQADQDGRPSGAALPVVDLSVIRGVGSSTVVRGSVGSYRPVIAGAKLREGTTTMPRGRARSRESACLQCAFTPLAGARRRQRRTRNMVHGKNRIPYWIDRRLTGLAVSHDDATISLGLPIEPEDSQYGKYRLLRQNLLTRWGMNSKPAASIFDCMNGNTGLTEEFIYRTLATKDVLYEVLSSATAGAARMGYIPMCILDNGRPLKTFEGKPGIQKWQSRTYGLLGSREIHHKRPCLHP